MVVDLKKLIQDALKNLSLEGDSFVVDVPNEVDNGDYSTNVAMTIAKKVGKNPKDLAEEIIKGIEKPRWIEKIEVADPGFINFYLSEDALLGELKTPKKSDFLKGEKINIEFISANPTGALHLGHGRGAFFGDALARVFSYAGAQVTREFYINDSKESKQIIELGKTALGKGKEYKTEDLEALLGVIDIKTDKENEAGFLVAEALQKRNKDFIEKDLGIPIEVWFSEEEDLHKKKLSEKVLEELKNKGLSYEKDGALWLATTKEGDDEDRVLMRSDGTKTYFVADIAYHEDKFKRGFNRVIDVWGADHHGHVKRMQAVNKMFGWKGEFKVFITQLVSLREGGEVKRMSKRLGTVILLQELLSRIGIDVLRWFYLEKSLNTHMEINMELAQDQSQKNPVFYVQYAHARASSILREPNKKGKIENLDETESKLAKKLIHFNEVVEDICKNYQVHKLTTYLYELANEFNQFYRDAHVVGDKREENRLVLVGATQKTLAMGLSLLGIHAPDKM